MTRMSLTVPTSVEPFLLTLDEPLTDELLQEICEINDVFHIEREPDGRLLVRKIGGTLAGAVGLDLMCDLIDWAKKDGRGTVLPNVGFLLPDGSMRGPRIAWISNAKKDELTEEQYKGFPPLCPEFVAEIMSFNYDLPELQARMLGWIAHGVELAWLIDPVRKVVEVYRPGREPEVLEGGSAVEGEGPVAGFVLELGRIWS